MAGFTAFKVGMSLMLLGAVFLALYVLTYACSAFTYWLCLRFSLQMSDRQIIHMNVITDAGAIGCRVIGAKNVDSFTLAHDGL